MSASRKFVAVGLIGFNVIVLLLTIHRLAVAGSTFTRFVPFVSNSPPVYISNLTKLPSISYNVRATGEITTTSVIPIHNITILITLFDSSNQVVGTKTGTTAFPATFQGQKNPFDIYSQIPNSQVAYITAQIIGWAPAVDQNFAAIDVVDMDIIIFPDVTRIVTTIQNNNPQPVVDVYGLAWSLRQGNALSPFLVSDFLAPGATGVFTSTVHDVEFPPYGAAAQGVTEP